MSFSSSTSRARCYRLLPFSVQDFEVSVLRQHGPVSGDVLFFSHLTFLRLSYPQTKQYSSPLLPGRLARVETNAL